MHEATKARQTGTTKLIHQAQFTIISTRSTKESLEKTYPPRARKLLKTLFPSRNHLQLKKEIPFALLSAK